MRSRLLRRGAALALLLGALVAVASTAWGWATDYAEAQHEITDKNAQLRSLRDLAEARTSFDRLSRRAGKGPLVLAQDGEPQAALATAINHAAEGQEVVLDGIDALPAETALTTAAVRLRGTQNGLYGFLRAIEEQIPYLTVPRLDVTLFRPADVDHHKPLVLSADVRVAALTAPAAPSPPAKVPDNP